MVAEGPRSSRAPTSLQVVGGAEIDGAVEVADAGTLPEGTVLGGVAGRRHTPDVEIDAFVPELQETSCPTCQVPKDGDRTETIQVGEFSNSPSTYLLREGADAKTRSCCTASAATWATGCSISRRLIAHRTVIALDLPATA